MTMNQPTRNKYQAFSTQLRLEGQDSAFSAIATWMDGKTVNTRNNYKAAIYAFFEFLQVDLRASPESQLDQLRSLTPLNISAWKDALKADGMSDTTIHNRLSIVSSMFTYLQILQIGGITILDNNPVLLVERKDLDIIPYSRARKITKEQFTELLAVINEQLLLILTEYTVASGKSKVNLRKNLTRVVRDRAMILLCALCACRRSDVVSLHGGDITHHSPSRITFRTHLKGSKVQIKEMPSSVWTAISLYLRVAGRQLSKTTPLFTATKKNKFSQKSDQLLERPISGRAMLYALKKYVRMTSIPEDSIDIHSLRHFGAELFYEINSDVLEINRFLNHAHPSTTQIYLQQLHSGKRHRPLGASHQLEFDLDDNIKRRIIQALED